MKEVSTSNSHLVDTLGNRGPAHENAATVQRMDWQAPLADQLPKKAVGL